MELRPYQSDAVSELERMLPTKRVVAVAPTGSGKTVIGGAVVHRFAGRVLWLAHRIELLEQAVEKIRAAGVPASDIGISCGARVENPGARVLVASIDKVRRGDVPPADLVVVDEAHRATAKGYQVVLDALPNARVLGLTATPWRLDGKGLGDVFDVLHIVATPVELAAAGHIATPVCYGMSRDKAREMVAGVKTNCGEFASGDLGRAMMRPALMGDTVSECARLAPGKRTVVFAATCEHAAALHRRFVESGRSAEYLDGKTPADERAAILARLKSGETEVVVNVDVLTEGFDCPEVKCIAMARPTQSLSRYLQFCGRALRPYRDERPIILDHAGNCWRHGLPHVDRDWTLDGRPKDPGEAPVKMCGECAAVMPASARTCPACGSEQPWVARSDGVAEGTLEVVRVSEDSRRRVRQTLARIAARDGKPSGWADAVYAMRFGAAL